MKSEHLILPISVLAVLTACKPGDPNIPEAATSAFPEKFPEARNVTWSMEKDHEWEFEFKSNGMKFSANFNSDGTWLETEIELGRDEIPESVRKGIETEFPGYSTEEAQLSETAEATSYEIILEKGETGIEAVFNDAGELLMKRAVTEDDETD